MYRSYKSEAADRKDLELPPGVNELIEKVMEANPRTVSGWSYLILRAVSY